MLNVTLTPTMLVFENLDDATAESLPASVEVKVNDKGQYYAKGKPEYLYKLLLTLSYDHDMEIN